MNSRTYDQVTDKFMDLSIEKTNSAYMLFYERIEAPDKNEGQDQAEAGPSEAAPIAKTPVKLTVCVGDMLKLKNSKLNILFKKNVHTVYEFMQTSNTFWMFSSPILYISVQNFFTHKNDR